MAAQFAGHAVSAQIASSGHVSQAAAVALVLAVPVVTWSLVGDQSTTGPDNADYVIRPVFRVSAGEPRVLRIVSLVLAIAAAAWLSWASVHNGFDLRWWSVIGPLLPLGILLGLGWRVFTAGVIGGNIGAGLYAFFAGPVMLALLVWAVFRTVTLLQ